MAPRRKMVSQTPATIPFGGSKGSVNTQILYVQYNDGTDAYKCKKCNSYFPTYGSVFAHMGRTHSDQRAANLKKKKAATRRAKKAAEQQPTAPAVTSAPQPEEIDEETLKLSPASAQVILDLAKYISELERLTEEAIAEATAAQAAVRSTQEMMDKIRAAVSG